VQPSRSRRLFRRGRLVNFLYDHLDRKLIVISASAGYGKTALLIDFASETALPVCWYSLDASDNDPHVFLEYLIATINHRFPQIGEQARRVLTSGESARDLEAVVRALVNELQTEITEPLIIVLDDYHAIAESDPINHLLDMFLALLPAQVHLIISSRALPNKLPLNRLQVRQEVAGLGTPDLKFTAEEIQSLFAQDYHIEITLERAAGLAGDFEGWIAGLLLTTPSLWDGLFHQLIQGQAAQEKLFNYLAAEAFSRLPDDVRQFLLDSSIFNRLEAATCDELLGMQNAGVLLQSLEDQNLFIVRLNDTSGDPWYRYHNLFQEFLRQRLIETNPTRWQDLNRRAAQFFEGCEGFKGQAIAHYLAAKMYDEAARTIDSIAQTTYDAGRWTSLTRWIDALPVEMIQTHPRLLVIHGMLFAESGSEEQTETAYAQAQAIYQSRHDELAVAQVSVWRAMFWKQKGRYREAIQACSKVLMTLRHHAAKVDQARAYRIIGSAYALLGDFPRGAKMLEKALKLYEDLGDQVRAAWLHHDLGTFLRSQGDPRAEEHYETALDYWRRTGNIVGESLTLNCIGVRYHQAGDWSRAMTLLGQAQELAHQSGNRRNEAFSLASIGDVYRDQGDFARALENYQSALSIGGDTDGYIRVYGLVALGETHHLAGHAREAEHYFIQALETAQAHQSNLEMGLAETALGIWQYQSKQIESATVHLVHAVELLSTACREQARARLHLARAYLLQRKFHKVKQQLRTTATECAALRVTSIPFLAADRPHLLPLIKYAVSNQIAASFYQPIYERLTAAPAPVMESTQPTIHVYALGTSQVMVNGTLLTKSDWVSATAKELFFLLIAHPKGLRREEILDILWGHKQTAGVAEVFNSTTYRLRRAVPNCLMHEDELYFINPALKLEYDVTQFTEALHHAEKARFDSERIKYYEAAISLYRGDYLRDSYKDWCVELRTQLHHQYLNALLVLAELCERRGQLRKALSYYRTLISKDKYREEIYRAIMRLQIRMADLAGAARTYRQCVQMLRDELGIPNPSVETQELYDSMIKGRQRKKPTEAKESKKTRA